MIKIPLNNCVIVSTLDLSQITQRLTSAIYVRSESDRVPLDRLETQSPDRQSLREGYFGQIQGYKFSATRLVGHKYFHLPAFLFPTIKGDINSLHHGYEISLGFKLHSIMFALMLGWLGGLLTTIGPALDNVFGVSSNYQYLTTVAIFAAMYVTMVIHLWVDAWRTKKFFRSLFAKEFAIALNSNRKTVQESTWETDLQFQDVGNVRSSTQLLRQNLPSFPRKAQRSCESGELGAKF